MTMGQAIGLGVQISMALMVFCVALGTQPRDMLDLVRRPGLLIRSLLAMYVIMPLVALALAIWFDFNPALEIALITMALAPVPPIVPGKEIKAGGNPSRIMGLLALTALASIVLIPTAVELLGRIFDRPAQISTGAIFRIVATSLLVPTIAGILLKIFAPALAARIARPLSLFATILLVASFLPIVIKVWPAMMALVGNFMLLAIIVFVAIGLAVGHLLGGPDPGDRAVLALSTATRHPAVTIGIVHASNPDDHSAPAAILLVLLFGAIVSIPYVLWRKRVHARASQA